MLNSAEHENLNAHKYKKFQEILLFLGSDKPRMLFFKLINVKMPTIYEQENFHAQLNWAWKKFYNLGARAPVSEGLEDNSVRDYFIISQKKTERQF